MDRFSIRGGVPLRGEVAVSGSKNSALALMAASLLTDQPFELSNVPKVRDVASFVQILQTLGLEASWEGEDRLAINGGMPVSYEAPYDLVRTMRASFMVLGPLVARCGRARVSLPGGCAIGARPVDQHLKGLEALGAKVQLSGGYVEAQAERLHGTRFAFDVRTVNGTQNVLMAACLASGTTLLENAAVEPEVGELVDVLCGMGALISGRGTDRLEIEGVSELVSVDHRVAGDRIEAGTLLIAAAITNGAARVTGVRPADLDALLAKLRETGLGVTTGPDWIEVERTGPLRGTYFATAPFPGFPTDMQAQMMALLCTAEGGSMLSETIFENRFMHVSELCRMGADVTVDGRTAFIQGVRELTGAPVMATDLRASASLVVAGLAARGETHVNRVYHIDRGYERIEAKLQALGGRIRREKV
jgi:UDP-N-acetylglucosamine 1-carboxyvinyltransferase